ncbi:transposase [Listeria welshimeri]|nr:transposase [Listeria welshimeri]
MTKYDDGFKRKVVEAYQNGEGGYGTLAQHFGIPVFSTVHKWMKIAEKQGGKALQRHRTKHHYTSQFKHNVIHYYLNSSESYLDVALRYGLPSGGITSKLAPKTSARRHCSDPQKLDLKI